MRWDYDPPTTSIPYEMRHVAELIRCDCRNLRPVTIAAKNTLAANTDAQTLLTYTVPPNTTLLITRISGRFIPTPNDASLGAGDFRSGDVDAQGGALAFVKVNSQSKTGETTTYFALLNQEFFIAFEQGAVITIVVDRETATTPPTEVSLLAIQGYLMPPQSLECITRAQGSIDEANPSTVSGSGLPAFFAVTLSTPQTVDSDLLTATFGAGRLLLYPTLIPASTTFDRVTIENTTLDPTASVTVALYDSTKTLLVSGNSGSLAAAGKNTISLTQTTIAAGLYWVGVIEVVAQVSYRVNAGMLTNNGVIRMMNADGAKVFIGDGGAVSGSSAPSSFSTITAPAYATGLELKIPIVYFWLSTAV